MKKVVLLILLVSTLIYANDDQWDNDFYLKNLANGNKFDAKSKKLFKKLVQEYGIATSMPFNEPAETLGRKGFEIAPVYSIFFVGNEKVLNESPWQGTFKGENQDNLHMINIRVRKGLPYSIELGGNFSYIFGSHMFVFGLDAKVALIEGINFLPDLAIRASYSHLFGSRQVNLNNMSLDFMISYDFGIAGTFALAPYFALSLTRINSQSNLIATKTDESPFSCESSGLCDYNDDSKYMDSMDEFGEISQDLIRYVIGFRFNNAAFIFTPEVILTAESVYGVNIKVGVDF